jgi:Domain of unknown function (DUF5664)
MSAIKHDTEKPRMELVPGGAVLAIADVFTFGAKKYAAHNWRAGFNWSRLIGALERHVTAFKEGEDLDPESGLPHLAHAGCCVMMLLEHQRLNYGVDDRYKTVTVPKRFKTIRTNEACHNCESCDIFTHDPSVDKYYCNGCGAWLDTQKSS